MSETLTLVIGTRRLSSWSLRPWLALRMAGAAFKEIEIALRQPDTKARILEFSPSGKVPLLIHGDVKVWDSLAICEYAHELFPGAGLWPDDAKARAVARAVAAEMHSGFPNLRSVCAMDVCATTPLGEVPPEVAAETGRIRAVWADCRQRFGAKATGKNAGPFLFGRFTIADAMYAPVVTRFTTYALPQDATSQAYCDAIWGLPPMRSWRESACL
ncbi:MAG: glutathione S-transferase family protein [Magnetospirillum sp.]|nr:glutathione S-transferase family protein [Magnetospirillum sp.]